MARHDIPGGQPAHQPAPGCYCNPLRTAGNRGDGTNGVLYLHQPVDLDDDQGDDQEATDAVAHD